MKKAGRVDGGGELARRLGVVARELLAAVPGKIARASLIQVMTGLGTCIDTMRLQRGESVAGWEEELAGHEMSWTTNSLSSLSDGERREFTLTLTDRTARLPPRPRHDWHALGATVRWCR